VRFDRPLTGPDLLIALDRVPHAEWLEPWSWLVGGRRAARCMSRFGCWFLEHPSGQVEMLDVFYGQVERVASSFGEFESLASDASWQEVYLLSRFVSELHESGQVASGTDCYVFAPPPLAGGPDPWAQAALSTRAVMVVDVAVAQGIYSQTSAHARELGPA
jgi:hypothetical protein